MRSVRRVQHQIRDEHVFEALDEAETEVVVLVPSSGVREGQVTIQVLFPGWDHQAHRSVIVGRKFGIDDRFCDALDVIVA